MKTWYCKHDWVLEFRDGPTDTNDWKCTKCGEMKSTQGPPERDRTDEEIEILNKDFRGNYDHGKRCTKCFNEK